jgi:hypothetical protein
MTIYLTPIRTNEIVIQWIVIGIGVLIAIILIKKIMKKPKNSKIARFDR